MSFDTNLLPSSPEVVQKGELSFEEFVKKSAPKINYINFNTIKEEATKFLILIYLGSKNFKEFEKYLIGNNLVDNKKWVKKTTNRTYDNNSKIIYEETNRKNKKFLGKLSGVIKNIPNSEILFSIKYNKEYEDKFNSFLKEYNIKSISEGNIKHGNESQYKNDRKKAVEGKFSKATFFPNENNFFQLIEIILTECFALFNDYEKENFIDVKSNEYFYIELFHNINELKEKTIENEYISRALFRTFQHFLQKYIYLVSDKFELKTGEINVKEIPNFDFAFLIRLFIISLDKGKLFDIYKKYLKEITPYSMNSDFYLEKLIVTYSDLFLSIPISIFDQDNTEQINKFCNKFNKLSQ